MHSLSLLSFSCLTRTNRLFFPFVFSIDRSLRLLCFSLSLRSSISFKNLLSLRSSISFKNLHALFRALCQSSTSASLESRTLSLFSLTFFPLLCRPSGQRFETLAHEKKKSNTKSKFFSFLFILLLHFLILYKDKLIKIFNPGPNSTSRTGH